MSPVFWIAPAASIVALVFALVLALRNMRLSEGTEPMKEIAHAVKVGAYAYLKQQYKGVGIFFAVVTVLFVVLVLTGSQLWTVPIAFVTGGFFSGLAGYIGMAVGVRSSARTTWAARQSLNAGLRVAFSAGMVMGMTVVGLGLLFLSAWYLVLHAIFSDQGMIASAMVASGIGASAMALFARVGGGIFTKAADVGADLVGKIEAGIPEDDPRNPAVIADNVGDNVGDIAGMGADLYESYIGSVVATMALAVAAFGVGTEITTNGMLFPMVLAGVGIIAAILASFLVRVGEKAEQAVLLRALRFGTYGATVLVAIAAVFLVRLMLPASFSVYWAVLAGLLSGVLIGYFTEMYTSDSYRPVRGIAEEAKTSPATLIIEGLSVGMSSTIPVVIVVAAAIAVAFFLGGGGDTGLGLYCIGVAAVGMLSTLGITLATDAYGPVADNAGGNAEMTHQEPIVRERTDALDSLGNTTAATGKGFAIGSAALTALALIAAYISQAEVIGNSLGLDLSIDLSVMNPRLMIGVFLGAMLPMGVSAMIIKAVGRAASKIAEEVRRQFREIAGIMEGKTKPDYASAVRICTLAAQREMLAPTLLAIVSPVVVGVLFGVEGVVGLLVGGLSSGFCMAVFMANAGGAWDNVNKYIEEG
ncbi:MAG: sodium-translocating pyrophosphatase, partial [bacterium]